MSGLWLRLSEMIAGHGAAAMVTVHAVAGSAPREAGARMIVRPDGAFHGTIGGGRLEWEALAAARAALAEGRGPVRRIDRALGPDLGQCCGGRVVLLVETFDGRDAVDLAVLAAAEARGPFDVACRMVSDGRVERRISSTPRPRPARDRSLQGGWTERHGDERSPLLLFGAGHVGRALVLALAPLPFCVRWVDSRPDAFPARVPQNVVAIRTDDPVGELTDAPCGAFVLVMTHDHPLDLAITAAALRRQDLPVVGLIGSSTKRARFEKRLRELGIGPDRMSCLVCPIGVPGIGGKAPAMIAASVAAQLLQQRERLARSGGIAKRLAPARNT